MTGTSYKPIRESWMCRCDDNEVEKLFTILDLFNYTTYKKFRDERHMNNENYVVFDNEEVCRATNPSTRHYLFVFKSIDTLITHHMRLL